METINQILARELNREQSHIDNVIKLLDEGNTIPFIARYRKEMHGSMDDTALRTLAERLAYLRALAERRETVKNSITEQGKMTPELSAAIAYEDEDVVVFDKPPYMPVHPSIRHHDDTLANLFAARYPGISFRPINRLDRNTSGLCVCAKNRFAASVLADSLQKAYFAITNGTPPGNTVNAPIGREGDSIIRRCVTPEGKPAVTHFEPVGGNSRRTLLRVTLETGRTHQIRVHMAYLGFPLCGDEMYGGDMSAIERQALHCGEVSFTQPVTHEMIHVSAPLPEDMATLIKGETT